MAFKEEVKLAVKRKSHFRCCLCEKLLHLEIHHIIPQAEGGPDDEENAAPLCPSCHETYGANPTKRKFIREKRDHWYELCAQHYARDENLQDEIKSMVKQAVEEAGEGLPSLTTHSIEVPPDLAFSARQRRQLRDALLACRYMKDPHRLQQVTSDLQKDFPGLYFESNRDIVLGIAGVIDSCLDFSGASCLQELLFVLEGYEGTQSNTMKAVWSAWKGMTS
jgi:hypothetical protein